MIDAVVQIEIGEQARLSVEKLLPGPRDFSK
jgi:hypothetical protein